MSTYENTSSAFGGTRERHMGLSEEMEERARRQAAAPWVLVVDDDALAARGAARLLSGATGVRVAVVSNVEQALRLLTRADTPPAAAVLDFELDGGEMGLTVLLSMRAAGIEVPCAFHTGAAQAARSALRKSRLGDAAYPVFDKGRTSPAELVQWVRERLGTDGAVNNADNPHRSGIREKLV
ncbi:MAG TPA: response regulator [Polyangiaceae bacterium]|nr:response regulator [Polyangiaceae bacterium]